MKRHVMVVGVALAVVLLGLVAAGCKDDDHEGHEHTAAPSVDETPDAAAEIAQKTCPVMDGAINKDIYTDHEGRRVYFCCAGCVDAFKKDPDTYLAKVDAEIEAAEEAAAPNE